MLPYNFCFHLTGSDFALSKIFGEMETVKERLNIEDYSVSQTTLDQVKKKAICFLVSCYIPIFSQSVPY